MNSDLNRGKLENALATPLIFLPGQCEEERLIAAAQMIQRSLALRAFIDMKISWDDYLSLLDEQGINAISVHGDWSEGYSYL